MNFSELARLRQSVRRYSEQPVEREKLLECIETARLSPSAHNSQPWKFIIVDEPDLKNQLAECAASLGMNKFVGRAPVVVAVVLERMNTLTQVGSVIKDKEFSLMDIGIAVNQFCLQASDIGLGTCIIGWFNEKKVRQLLHVDNHKRIPLLISVGYSDSPVREKVRKPLEEICSWNRYA